MLQKIEVLENKAHEQMREYFLETQTVYTEGLTKEELDETVEYLKDKYRQGEELILTVRECLFLYTQQMDTEITKGTEAFRPVTETVLKYQKEVHNLEKLGFGVIRDMREVKEKLEKLAKNYSVKIEDIEGLPNLRIDKANRPWDKIR